MDIMYITESFFPEAVNSSGRVLTETARCFADMGHKVRIVTRRRNPELPAAEEYAGMKIRRYESDGTVKATASALNPILQSETAEAAPDIVVATHAAPGMVAFRSSFLRNVPKVREFHSAWSENYRGDTEVGVESAPSGLGLHLGIRSRRRADRYTLKQAGCIRVLSNGLAKEAAAICPSSKERIVCIPAGVNCDSFWPEGSNVDAREHLDLPPKRTIIFTLSRFRPGMGLETLIDAMHEVRLYDGECLLVIGGGGPLKDALQARIEKLGLSFNVQLIDHIVPHFLAWYYQAADLVVLPPREREGSSLSILEAMACGIPVLAGTSSSSVTFLGKLGHACLFDGTDTRAISQKICTVLNSPKALAQMARVGHGVALKEFTWAVSAKKLMQQLGRLKRLSA